MRRALVSMLVLLLLGVIVGLGSFGTDSTPSTLAQGTCDEGTPVTPIPSGPPEGTPAAEPVASPAASPEADLGPTGLFRTAEAPFDLENLPDVPDDYFLTVGAFCLEVDGAVTPAEEYVGALVIVVQEGSLKLRLTAADQATTLKGGDYEDLVLPAPPFDEEVDLVAGESIRLINPTFEIENNSPNEAAVFIAAGVGPAGGGCTTNCWLP